MDKVFQEEQRKLVEIEGKIDRVASRYEMEANKHSREIRDAFCIDYEDVMRLQESKKAYSSALERAEKYRAYQKSPYFGRIDLDQEVEDGIETDVFYIGKEGIGDGADDFVTDWRTPINDLSAELGLDTIERFSVEEYYVSLIKRYSSKIAADPIVQSEKVLDTELLTKVYSTDYMTTAIEHYHEYWKQVLALLNEKRLREVFQKQRIEYPITASHTNDIVSKLDSGIIRITRADAEAKRKYKDLRTRIITISKDSEAVQEEHDQATVALYHSIQVFLLAQYRKPVYLRQDYQCFSYGVCLGSCNGHLCCWRAGCRYGSGNGGKGQNASKRCECAYP